mmetsp:Transcript_12023/g.30289  ORF Transcript_12023/g.30289 Transcript_12023/m.30289 type:complete len:219 (+) Transcript_12023:1278-1934(+)
MQRRSGGTNSSKISKSSTTPTPANLKGNTSVANTPGSASRRIISPTKCHVVRHPPPPPSGPGDRGCEGDTTLSLRTICRDQAFEGLHDTGSAAPMRGRMQSCHWATASLRRCPGSTTAFTFICDGASNLEGVRQGNAQPTAARKGGGNPTEQPCIGATRARCTSRHSLARWRGSGDRPLADGCRASRDLGRHVHRTGGASRKCHTHHLPNALARERRL